MTDYTPEQMEEQAKLCIELPLIHQRLFRSGLLKTAHKMTEAVRAIGYERARIMEELPND